MDFQLKPGALVTLHTDIDVDEERGSSSSILFEGTVDRYIPKTRKLSFKESDVGWAEFENMLDEAHGYQVMLDYHR